MPATDLNALKYIIAAAAAAKSLQSCLTLCNPIDGSSPGSPTPGILHARIRSGLPFLSPMRESEVAQSCPTLSDPMDCGPPGSSIHGIFQARVLEWGATAFSKNGILRHHKNKDFSEVQIEKTGRRMEK